MLQFRRDTRENARKHPLGAVQLLGDYGGRPYVIRAASSVRAPESALRQLAIDLDAVFEWHLADATDVWWCIANPWDQWDGSPPAIEGFWLDPRLVARGIDPAWVDAVLLGKSPRLSGPE